MMRPFRHLAFERVLAAWLAKRLCDGCGKPLGEGPEWMINRKRYHLECKPPCPARLSAAPAPAL
jgi:hypothetical protein